MAALIVISWRDVPAQVIVKRGREVAKVPLSARFQEAVDRAAMRAGRGSSDAYLEDWRRSAPRPCGDDLQARVPGRAESEYGVVLMYAVRLWYPGRDPQDLADRKAS
jgi:Virulence factor